MKHFTLIKASPTFGFATGEDGTEYYVPKHVMVSADIDEEDVGHSFTAEISKNKSRDSGSLDLISLPFVWDQVDEDVIANLEDAIGRASDLLADLRLATAEPG